VISQDIQHWRNEKWAQTMIAIIAESDNFAGAVSVARRAASCGSSSTESPWGALDAGGLKASVTCWEAATFDSSMLSIISLFYEARLGSDLDINIPAGVPRSSPRFPHRTAPPQFPLVELTHNECQIRVGDGSAGLNRRSARQAPALKANYVLCIHLLCRTAFAPEPGLFHLKSRV